MAVTDLLMIGLGIDTRRLRDGERALGRLQQAGNKAENALGRMASMLASAFAVSKIIEYADAYTNLQNRLKLVTDSTEALGQATQNVIDIAQNSRQSLGATGDLYFKISQNADKLGLSVADVSQVTETFGKTLALSGAGTQQAEAAILQFSQALASGVIRGDEFNSVAENAPAAMDAFSRALGVTKGDLRKLAAEGSLTSDVLIQALKEQSEEVDKAFGKTESTISQAFTNLKNNVIVFVGQMNEATGASKDFVSVLDSISSWLEGGQLFDDVIYQTKIWGYALDDVSDAFKLLNAWLKSIGVDSDSIFGRVGKSLKTLPTDFTALVKIANAEWTKFSDTVAEGMIIHSTRKKEIDDAYNKTISNILGERDARLSASDAAVKAIQDERAAKKAAREDEKFFSVVDELLAEKSKLTSKEMLEASRKKAEADKIAKKAAEDATKKAEQLKSQYDALALSQLEQIELWGKDTGLAKLNFDLKYTNLSKLGKKEKDNLILQQQKIDALQAEKDLAAQQTEVDSFMAGQAQELDALRAQYATENEIIYQGYMARQAIIDEALGREKISKDEARDLSKKNERQTINEKRQLEVQKLGVLSQGFGNIATLMQSENRKLFEIGKAAALAQAFVNTATAITNALAVQPYPLGLALAATAGVAGAVQIAAIQNQQISGARAMGGDVQGGKSYLVGERGAEVITMGGNGHVTPNHKLGGGDSKITIVNQTTGRIDNVEEKTMPDGERILIIQQARDLIAAEMRDPNSKTSRSMQSSLTVQRRR
jgi:tape measure domain-containing protein